MCKEFKQIKSDLDISHFATIFLAMVEGGLMMSRTFQEAKYMNDCMAHLTSLVENIRE